MNAWTPLTTGVNWPTKTAVKLVFGLPVALSTLESLKKVAKLVSLGNWRLLGVEVELRLAVVVGVELAPAINACALPRMSPLVRFSNSRPFRVSASVVPVKGVALMVAVLRSATPDLAWIWANVVPIAAPLRETEVPE